MAFVLLCSENYVVESEFVSSPANQRLECLPAPRADQQALSASRLDTSVDARMRQETTKSVQVFVKSANPVHESDRA
jgi:hypothetical protein